MIQPSRDSPGMGNEEMRYGIFGDTAPSPDEQIEKYTGEVDWNYLRPHFNSGALIFVDPTVPLQDAARAFSEDDREKVAAWLKCGDLLRPGEPHAIYWEDSGARFNAVVVSPFVLIQPVVE